MKSIIALGMCLAAITCGTACNQITVSFMTTALPGRTATLDPESDTLHVSRGLAVALECSEWTESYSGPCRDMTVGVEDDDLADILPVHLDAFGPSGNAGAVRSYHDGDELYGTAARAGALIAAKSAGETTLLVTSEAQDVALTLVVEPTPGDEQD